ncbi:MAG: PD40 domain-containing protein [Flavobacteriales bacterium]|nr:PD40 domain-containing protein [Flavobacteriales bacterium]
MKIFTILLALSLNYSLALGQGIIFAKQVNNNDNLYFINKKGQTRQITNHNRKDSSPMVSPNGKSIVFTSERVGWWKIWLMDIKENKFKQLTHLSDAEYGPSWSPDGNHIVFVSSRNGNQEIFIMTKDGKNIHNITNSNTSDTMPFWSNDNYIYYSSEVKGVYQIARCKSDGTNKEIITNSKGNKLMPQLSNDLTRILYYSDVDGNYEIYVMNVIDKMINRLTNHPLMDIRPRWSSDDSQIVFERGNKGNNHHIYKMDAEGKNVKQLTFKNYNYAPSFINKNK